MKKKILQSKNKICMRGVELRGEQGGGVSLCYYNNEQCKIYSRDAKLYIYYEVQMALHNGYSYASAIIRVCIREPVKKKLKLFSNAGFE